MKYTVIIPARFDSTRLPGKLLKEIHGKSLLQRTYENACKSKAEEVIIATSDAVIADHAEGFGAEVIITCDHDNGTSRVVEVVNNHFFDIGDIVVNVQADEPMISPQAIDQVAEMLTVNGANIATLCEPITDIEDYYDTNCVKVVRDATNRAQYFSRAPIPHFRDREVDLGLCYRHVGIYAYRSYVLQRNMNTVLPNANAEMLEQLNFFNGLNNIQVEEACAPTGYGVDTQDDLERVRLEFEHD